MAEPPGLPRRASVDAPLAVEIVVVLHRGTVKEMTTTQARVNSQETFVLMVPAQLPR